MADETMLTGQTAPTLPDPGPLGRLFRFFLGLLCTYALYASIAGFLAWGADSALTDVGLMVAAVLALLSLPPVIDVGFSTRIGHALRRYFLAVYAMLVAAAFVAPGSAWPTVAGAALYGLVWFTYGLLAPSMVAAAILAVPG